MKRSPKSLNQEKKFMKKWLRSLFYITHLAMEIIKLGRKEKKRN